MKLTELNKIFDIEYGSQLDFNKLTIDTNGVNFVTRSRRNLGITQKVKKIEGKEPFKAGLITVTLGGSYLLSSFIQPKSFYTAQNIKVLKPREKMSFNETVYYCNCIELNRFKYSSHGREANRSLNNLLVPERSEIPKFINEKSINDLLSKIEDFNKIPYPYNEVKKELIPLHKLFDFQNGVNIPDTYRNKIKLNNQFIPLIRPSKTQISSFVEYVDTNLVDKEKIFDRETIYVSTNGQGSHSYSYISTFRFVPNSDITVLTPKRKMTLREKIFYANVITINRPNFSYGRKPKGKRLKQILVPNIPPKFVFEKEMTIVNQLETSSIT